MGANAQTAVPAFTAGQVLTAAQQTQINTGIPVFATTTTRDAAFGGTGEKTLAEGQFAYLEDTNTTQYYDGSTWQTVGGLTLIKTQTIGSAVSSVTVSDVFSATYDNYYLSVVGGAASATCDLNLTLGATTSGYYWSAAEYLFSGTVSGAGSVNGSSIKIGQGETLSLSVNANIFNPFASNETFFTSQYVFIRTTNGAAASLGGFLNNTTSYTAFTITPSTGTLTGGIIRVYGYSNS